MNPIQVSERITKRLRNYIRKALPIERSAPAMAPVLDAYFAANPLGKDPILELVPDYLPGVSMQQLANEKVILPRTAQVFANYFSGSNNADPGAFCLHAHQEAAIREVCGANPAKRNLVVCSGTGSGKTEVFLIPLVDSLLREHQDAGLAANQPLGAGVRALILYPMNALVNDQIRRLRGVLKYAGEITFGKYTGETEHNQRFKPGFLNNLEGHEQAIGAAASDNYAGLDFDDEQALPNEVTTRRKWRDSQAHILVTNYSMLERLLIQPQGSNLFGANWRFIVLDEAHSYGGGLGTEIAWLIRRLRARVESFGTQPDSLRYLATSATLISGKQPEDEKKKRIRNEFASKLFPASQESFAVQFGVEKPVPVLEGQYSLTPAQWMNLDPDDRLLIRSQQFLGRKSWHGKMSGLVSRLLNANGEVAIGDLLVVVDGVNAAIEAGLFGGVFKMESRLLDQQSEPAINCLAAFLEAGVGGFNGQAYWKEWLHDEGDPKQAANGGQGNRLHILNEWQRPDRWNMTGEALEWMVSIATELAVASEADMEPAATGVRLANGCCQWLQTIFNSLTEINNGLQQEGEHLDSSWRLACHAQGLNSPDTGFQAILASALENDGGILRLKNHLRGLDHAQDASDRASLSCVAAAVFPKDAGAKDALVRLVSIGTMAKPTGSRTPLLDVRYHQLIRGVEPPGVKLTPDNNGSGIPSLLPERMDDTLCLGVCRECGQPFALGYCDAQTLQGVQQFTVRSLPGAKHQYLHAFAWTRGEVPEGCDEPNDLDNQNTIWLDAEDGKIEIGMAPPNDGPWVQIVDHAGPDTTAKEFIAKCPTCGEIQQNNSSTRYGIITPYEISGTQVKVIVLEELARNSDASSGPAASRHPGNGRKVLAFSDSRSAAAEMAWRFQDYAVESIVARGIVEVAGDLTGYLADVDVLAACGMDPNNPFIQNNMQAFVAQAMPSLAPNIRNIRFGLKNWIEKHNLSGLLAVAKVDGQDMPIGDLDLPDAAEFRMLEALRKQGRNGILRKRMVMLSSQGLNGYNAGKIGMPDEAFDMLSHQVIVWMLEKLQFNLKDGFSREINRGKVLLEPNGNGQYLDAQIARHGLNTRVRCAIIEHTNFWEQDCRNQLTNLPVTFNQQPFANALAQLGFDELRSILGVVCEQREASWLGLLNGQIPGAAPTTQKAVFRAIRQWFMLKANGLLQILWPLLSNNGGLLVPAVGNAYRMNQDAIQVLPWPIAGDGAGQDVPVGYEEEDSLRTRDIIPLRCEEHTAQIASSRGSAYQRAFADGRINILSCSTTFEMGVDLGDLSCVFLNGMPPGVANYRQRAGRAGRRPGSSSYVLTFMGSSSHDRYFWHRPGDLLFAPMDAPKIYLENQLFRARHLRAEAFQHFLLWASDNNRMTTQRIDDPTLEHKRRWDKCGDFFIGMTAAWTQQNGGWNVTVGKRFAPVVTMLPDWHCQHSQAVQQRVQRISDVGQLDYKVADDLVWQLLTQAQCPIAPYELDDENGPNRDLDYRMLGGCHLPGFTADDVRRQDIQFQLGSDFGQVTNNTISPFQRYLLGQQTVTQLACGRALPIYGFPVDVIRLKPDRNDPHQKDVKLERDLRIGLYEYAPGRVVTADKRRYLSAETMVIVPGQPNPVSASVIAGDNTKLICPGCHEPDWRDNLQSGTPCRYCGQGLELVRLVRPDYFQAKMSTSGGGGLSADRGAAVHVHTGGFRLNPVRLNGTRLVTKESVSGIITYINRGPGNQGFGNPPTYSLFHEIRTDIAGWMLPSGIAAQGTPLHGWTQNAQGGRNRWNAAMKSALHAILRAAARVKSIEDRDIGGLALPMDANVGECGFVLFDESSGGGGVVLNLVLSGKEDLDIDRETLIRRILVEAVQLCGNCACGTTQQPMNRPLPRMEYLSLDQNARVDCRPASSCYNCLRNYRNQRDHEFLDRYDAAKLLEEVLQAPAVPHGVLDRQALEANQNPPEAFSFLLDDGSTRQLKKLPIGSQPAQRQWALVRLPENVGYAYGDWVLMQRTGGPRLRLLNGLGLEDGLPLENLTNLAIWV